MELTDTQSERISELLAQMEDLDPAELPDPAAELAALLGDILEGTETA